MKKLLLIGACSLALSAGAHAQEVENEDSEGSVGRVLDRVFVTTTKKADPEEIQDVPQAVTAFNEGTLEALKVRDLESLSYSSPNVALDEVGTTRGTANFSIRGLGVNSSIPSIDPTVGVFVDGVYMGINNGIVFDVFDLDSIEIARGPQGLLFGRNTTGGAVVLNTGNPTDDFQAKGRVSWETPIDDDRGGASSIIQATISGPLVEGKLNGKVAAYFNSDDGYFKNLFNGEDHGAADTTILRGALEWTPTSDLTFLGKIERFESDGDGPATQNRGFFDRESFDFSVNTIGNYESEATTASLRTDWDVEFGNGTITNIFGYRSYENDAITDLDGTGFTLLDGITNVDQEQVSNELRYSGTFGNASVTTGLFYFEQEVAYDEQRIIPPLVPLTFYGGGRQDHTVFGIFGQVDYSFTENLIATLGLRYSTEEKDADLTFIIPRPVACSVIDNTCPADSSDKNDWSNVTPKLGVQYFFSEDAQAYASYTRGFRSGGYNFRITNPALFLEQLASTGEASFDEESVDAFEIGSKNTFADGQGQLNLALFHTQIEDMQREVSVASLTSGVSQFIFNTADASITGIEAEGRFAFTDSFLVTANIGLIDAEYDEVRFDISGDGVVDGADTALALPRVPEATYGFGFIYDHNLGSLGGLTARANYQHRDRFAYTDNNFGFINEADILDAFLTWRTPMEGIELSIFGKNLLDEVTAGADTQIPFGGPLSTGVAVPFGAPAAGTASFLKRGRRVGVELSGRF